MSDNTFKAKAGKVWGSVKVYCRVKKAIAVMKHRKRVTKVKKFFKGDDFRAVIKSAFTVFMDGILISGLLYYFIGFSWPLVPAFGAGWFFAKKDIIPSIVKLVSALNLVKIGK
jgi:hypothetical protein